MASATIQLESDSFVKRCIYQFGRTIGRPDLAEIVADLWDAALEESSHRTYRTGQRAYLKYIKTLTATAARNAMSPFQRTYLNFTELHLAFFIAHLVLQPSIKAGSTIAGYVVHVKYGFREAGCDPSAYDTVFLRQVKTGVKKSFPSGPDKRHPFLLPQYINRIAFLRPTEST